MATSLITAVPKLRRTPSSPDPVQTASSTSLLPAAALRSRNHVGPTTAPPMSRARKRRRSDVCATAWPNGPLLYPNARCCVACSTAIIRAPSSPVAIAVASSANQNRTVSRAVSLVLFGCSIAPRPEGNR